MAEKKNRKTKKPGSKHTETLEITKRSIKATGMRTAALVVATALALGATYIFVKYGKPTVTTSVQGDNGIAIGKARDVTVNNGTKEDK